MHGSANCATGAKSKADIKVRGFQPAIQAFTPNVLAMQAQA
jgi:hypothetical protein